MVWMFVSQLMLFWEGVECFRGGKQVIRDDGP